MKFKIGDKVKFKRFGRWETGFIIDIDTNERNQANGNVIKVKPDDITSYRQKIALKIKSITLI